MVKKKIQIIAGQKGLLFVKYPNLLTVFMALSCGWMLSLDMRERERERTKAANPHVSSLLYFSLFFYFRIYVMMERIQRKRKIKRRKIVVSLKQKEKKPEKNKPKSMQVRLNLLLVPSFPWAAIMHSHTSRKKKKIALKKKEKRKKNTEKRFSISVCVCTLILVFYLEKGKGGEPTWFLDKPVCRANRCLSASLGYLRKRPENDISPLPNPYKEKTELSAPLDGIETFPSLPAWAWESKRKKERSAASCSTSKVVDTHTLLSMSFVRSERPCKKEKHLLIEFN